MEITDIEQAIALYNQNLITSKGLVWFYLQDKQIAAHQINPKRASAELGISVSSLYYRLRELVQQDYSEGSSLP
jgi:DNA-binding NtrC family response regulator